MKSKTSHAVLDIKSRKEKAAAIIDILKGHKNIKNSKVLDIGTGSGVIAHEIGKLSKNVHAVDLRDERVLKSNYKFKKTDSEKLPFSDKEFDIVISNHVMAHVKDNDLHLSEIKRVLKDDGIVYLSMLNRLWPLEPNFNLMFLSWMPKKTAGFYLRLMKKGESYDVNPLAYFSFAKKLTKDFSFEDVTIKIIKKNFSVPHYAYKMLKIFSPVWIFVLRKKH